MALPIAALVLGASVRPCRLGLPGCALEGVALEPSHDGSWQPLALWDTDTLPYMEKAEWRNDPRREGGGNTSCVSIAPGTNNQWCAIMCSDANPKAPDGSEASCPPSKCRCDAEARKQLEDEAKQLMDNWKEAEERVRSAKPNTAYPDGMPPIADDERKQLEDALPSIPELADSKALAKSAKPETCVSIKMPATNKWCINQCGTEVCPPDLCECEDYTDKEKKQLLQRAKTKEMDQWRENEARTRAAKPGVAYGPDGLPAVDPNASPAPGPADLDNPVPLLAEPMKRTAAASNPESCKGIRDDVTDAWCAQTCATEKCPPTMCKCEEPSEASAAPEVAASAPAPAPEPPKPVPSANTEGGAMSAGTSVPIPEGYGGSKPAGIDVPLAPVGTPTGIDATDPTWNADAAAAIKQDLDPKWDSEAAEAVKQDLDPSWDSGSIAARVAAASPVPEIQDLDPYWASPAASADGEAAANGQAADAAAAANDAAAKEMASANAAAAAAEQRGQVPEDPTASDDPYANAPAPAVSEGAPAPVPEAPTDPYANAPAPADGSQYQTATDDSCRSLVQSTNDYWCATTCAHDKSPTACPPDICQCGPSEEQNHQEKEEMRAAADTLPSSPGAA